MTTFILRRTSYENMAEEVIEPWSISQEQCQTLNPQSPIPIPEKTIQLRTRSQPRNKMKGQLLEGQNLYLGRINPPVVRSIHPRVQRTEYRPSRGVERPICKSFNDTVGTSRPVRWDYCSPGEGVLHELPSGNLLSWSPCRVKPGYGMEGGEVRDSMLRSIPTLSGSLVAKSHVRSHLSHSLYA